MEQQATKHVTGNVFSRRLPARRHSNQAPSLASSSARRHRPLASTPPPPVSTSLSPTPRLIFLNCSPRARRRRPRCPCFALLLLLPSPWLPSRCRFPIFGAPAGIGEHRGSGAGTNFAPSSVSGPGRGKHFRDRGGDGGRFPDHVPPRCHPDSGLYEKATIGWIPLGERGLRHHGGGKDLTPFDDWYLVFFS